MLRKTIFTILMCCTTSWALAITAAQIESDVSILSKQTPSRVDEYTTLRSVLFVNTLFYKGVVYTMQTDADEASLKNIEPKLKAHIKSSMCSGSWTRDVLGSGYAIDHLYQDRSGKAVVMNRLVAKDCK